MILKLLSTLGLLLVLLSTLNKTADAAEQNGLDFPACDIFCHGELLHTIQMAHIFTDSKTFVDLKLKHLPNTTNEHFKIFMSKRNHKPSIDDIKQFVKDHFENGEELTYWKPSDWTNNPRFLKLIRNPTLRQWGSDLNQIWKILGRQMIDDVHKNPNLYSIIPIENPVIVPGGRFKEFYYWDSYWIIRGLLYSEMHNTARGMLLNFLSMIERFGFIPNGGRIYYAERSQPPLLAGMIDSYVEFTGDKKFAIDSVELLEKEFHYWKTNHMVTVNGHDLAVYRARSTSPRAESYREDVKSAEVFPTLELKKEFYSETATGAESGWDFSSRWFISKNNDVKGATLKDLKCRSIVPVDLNAFLYWNAKIIARFYSMSDNVEKEMEYSLYAKQIFEAIEAVLWNEEAGIWLDYDLINNKPRNYFSTSNLTPLWINAFNISNSEKISKSVISYIKKMELNRHPGGVPNTLFMSAEQWDFPNVWPPMQYILVKGMENLKTPEAERLSKAWGYRWVRSNYKAYNKTKVMFEKYDSEKFGGSGGGGEYIIQKGFGWTNGVIIELLAKYGSRITP